MSQNGARRQDRRVVGYANESSEYPHSVPKCQVCGRVGPWQAEPVLLTHHIVISLLLTLVFGVGLIYLVIVLIVRSDEASRAKICPNCGSRNMHTFVYADGPGGPALGHVAQPFLAAGQQAAAPSATRFNPALAPEGARSAVVYANGAAVRTLVLTPNTRYTVGRDPSCSVRVSEPMVSGRHGVFEVDGSGSLLYADTGSTNGSFLNGSRLSGPARIGPADILALGSDNMRITVSM